MSTYPFDILVFDSDGILSSGGTPLPCAQELIEHLNSHQLPYYILTNNPFLDAQAKHESYLKQGFDISKDKLYGAAHPLIESLKAIPKRHGKLYAIGVEDPSQILKEQGFDIDNDSKDIDGILLLDDDETWDADRVSYLLNLILDNPTIPLLVPNPDLVFPYKNQKLYLTSGAWAKLLQDLCAAKGIELNLTYLGKPFNPIFNGLQKDIDRQYPNIEKSRIAMIGDSPATDILGANQHGWSSILIKTGNYLYGQGQKNCSPNYTFEDLGAFKSFFLKGK